MRFLTSLILITLCCACSGNTSYLPSIITTPPWQGPTHYNAVNYNALKETITNHQQGFAKMYSSTGKGKDTVLKSARLYIYHYVTDSLFAYWYGTPWDYNGITEVPGKGKIACGYFVTTVLRDAGLPVARIKLAQAPASTLINTVCNPSSVKRFSNVQSLEQYLNGTTVPSLLVLGLDNHVGFVMHDATGNYFVHSSCVGAMAVEKQPLREAQPILASKSFMIGDILSNNQLLVKWLSQ